MLHQVADQVVYMRTLLVNVVMIGKPDSGEWVLVDAGIRGFAEPIAQAAGALFGAEKPRAIVLTHGHFDHIGALPELLARWDAPVFAQERELPYLRGEANYPEPDPTVGGGLLARLSPLYPNEATNLGTRVQPLPEDGAVPFLPEWRWIATPGHTQGHVSLFRASDRMLVAGDAFITVKQESVWAVLTQERQMHGPPAYFTPDWEEAWASVKRLAALQPRCAITGHGAPMEGEELIRELTRLARDFDKIAIPAQGQYVPEREITRV